MAHNSSPLRGASLERLLARDGRRWSQAPGVTHPVWGGPSRRVLARALRVREGTVPYLPPTLTSALRSGCTCHGG